jgi:hypothetical protein
MHTFETPGCRQSRRFEGIFDREDEIRGFQGLQVFIHCGLTGRENDIAEILTQIDGLIYSQYHFAHNRYLSFFGSKEDKLKVMRPVRPHGRIVASDWRSFILKGLDQPIPLGVPFISRLHSSDVNSSRPPAKNDLALFFCLGKHVQTSEKMGPVFKTIRNNSIWLLFDGADVAPEVSPKSFAPVVKSPLI